MGGLIFSNECLTKQTEEAREDSAFHPSPAFSTVREDCVKTTPRGAVLQQYSGADLAPSGVGPPSPDDLYRRPLHRSCTAPPYAVQVDWSCAVSRGTAKGIGQYRDDPSPTRSNTSNCAVQSGRQYRDEPTPSHKPNRFSTRYPNQIAAAQNPSRVAAAQNPSRVAGPRSSGPAVGLKQATASGAHTPIESSDVIDLLYAATGRTQVWANALFDDAGGLAEGADATTHGAHGAHMLLDSGGRVEDALFDNGRGLAECGDGTTHGAHVMHMLFGSEGRAKGVGEGSQSAGGTRAQFDACGGGPCKCGDGPSRRDARGYGVAARGTRCRAVGEWLQAQGNESLLRSSVDLAGISDDSAMMNPLGFSTERNPPEFGLAGASTGAEFLSDPLRVSADGYPFPHPLRVSADGHPLPHPLRVSADVFSSGIDQVWVSRGSPLAHPLRVSADGDPPPLPYASGLLWTPRDLFRGCGVMQEDDVSVTAEEDITMTAVMASQGSLGRVESVNGSRRQMERRHSLPSGSTASWITCRSLQRYNTVPPRMLRTQNRGCQQTLHTALSLHRYSMGSPKPSQTLSPSHSLVTRSLETLPACCGQTLVTRSLETLPACCGQTLVTRSLETLRSLPSAAMLTLGSLTSLPGDSRLIGESLSGIFASTTDMLSTLDLLTGALAVARDLDVCGSHSLERISLDSQLGGGFSPRPLGGTSPRGRAGEVEGTCAMGTSQVLRSCQQAVPVRGEAAGAGALSTTQIPGSCQEATSLRGAVTPPGSSFPPGVTMAPVDVAEADGSALPAVPSTPSPESGGEPSTPPLQGGVYTIPLQTGAPHTTGGPSLRVSSRASDKEAAHTSSSAKGKGAEHSVPHADGEADAPKGMRGKVGKLRRMWERNNVKGELLGPSSAKLSETTSAELAGPSSAKISETGSAEGVQAVHAAGSSVDGSVAGGEGGEGGEGLGRAGAARDFGVAAGSAEGPHAARPSVAGAVADGEDGEGLRRVGATRESGMADHTLPASVTGLGYSEHAETLGSVSRPLGTLLADVPGISAAPQVDAEKTADVTDCCEGRGLNPDGHSETGRWTPSWASPLKRRPIISPTSSLSRLLSPKSLRGKAPSPTPHPETLSRATTPGPSRPNTPAAKSARIPLHKKLQGLLSRGSHMTRARPPGPVPHASAGVTPASPPATCPGVTVGGVTPCDAEHGVTVGRMTPCEAAHEEDLCCSSLTITLSPSNPVETARHEPSAASSGVCGSHMEGQDLEGFGSAQAVSANPSSAVCGSHMEGKNPEGFGSAQPVSRSQWDAMLFNTGDVMNTVALCTTDFEELMDELADAQLCPQPPRCEQECPQPLHCEQGKADSSPTAPELLDTACTETLTVWLESASLAASSDSTSSANPSSLQTTNSRMGPTSPSSYITPVAATHKPDIHNIHDIPATATHKPNIDNNSAIATHKPDIHNIHDIPATATHMPNINNNSAIATHKPDIHNMDNMCKTRTRHIIPIPVTCHGATGASAPRGSGLTCNPDASPGRAERVLRTASLPSGDDVGIAGGPGGFVGDLGAMREHAVRVEGHSPAPQRLEGHSPSPQRVAGQCPALQRVKGHSPSPQRVEGHSPPPQRFLAHPPSPQRVDGHPPSPQKVKGHPPSPQRVGAVAGAYIGPGKADGGPGFRAGGSRLSAKLALLTRRRAAQMFSSRRAAAAGFTSSATESRQ